MGELNEILQKFAASGWELIAVPSRAWLDGQGDRDKLAAARPTRNAAAAAVNWTFCTKKRLPCCKASAHKKPGACGPGLLPFTPVPLYKPAASG